MRQRALLSWQPFATAFSPLKMLQTFITTVLLIKPTAQISLKSPSDCFSGCRGEKSIFLEVSYAPAPAHLQVIWGAWLGLLSRLNTGPSS